MQTTHITKLWELKRSRPMELQDLRDWMNREIQQIYESFDQVVQGFTIENQHRVLYRYQGFCSEISSARRSELLY